MIPRLIHPKLLSLFAFSLLGLCRTAYADLADFQPLSAEESTYTTPQVDPEADIEYLSRKIVVNDHDFGADRRIERHYRLMVYSENGVKALDVLHIPYEKGDSKIRFFHARVTNPDGKVYDLGMDDLYERTVYDKGSDEGNALSFSLPHLQVGSFVDYAWVENRAGESSWSKTILLEEEWPTLSLTIEVAPNTYWSSSLRGFNYELKFEMTKDKRFLVEASNIGGWKREPFSPPALNYRPWIFLRYVGGDLLDIEKFWDHHGSQLWDMTDEYVKPKQGAVKKLAAELFAGAKNKEEKLHRAYDYCCDEIENIYSVRAGYTSEERERLKDVDSPAATIKRGYGSGWDINCLFASLAITAGYEARLAYAGDSSRMMLIPSVLSREMNFPEEIVALRDGEDGDWRYFDPGYDYLPFEVLDYDNSEVPVLIADREKALTGFTPKVLSGRNVIFRNADLVLNEFGDLSGDVYMEYNGYPGVRMKRYYDSLSEAEREERFVKNLENTYPRCTISNLVVKNIFTRNEPLLISYTIEVPGYAESLGKRMFLQPNFFEYGETAMFVDEKRHTNIVFSYAWEERDEVWIRFPEGFFPEEASSPGKPSESEVMGYRTSYSLNKANTKMRCDRLLRVGGKEYLFNGYPAIKALLDDVNRQDTHVMTLVRGSE